jgi:hypothetical protein
MRRKDIVAIWGPPSTPSATVLIKDATLAERTWGKAWAEYLDARLGIHIAMRYLAQPQCLLLPAFKLGLQAMALWSTAADSVRQTVLFATNSDANG